MDFEEFARLHESTVLDLYKSTVDAFPRTTRRQNSVDTVRIIEMLFTPFLGMKTLLVRGTAKNMENQKEYDTLVLIKGVRYLEKETARSVPLAASGRRYILERTSAGSNEVLVRCSCPDFFWRFNHYNSEDASLYGRKRRRYESKGNGIVANPNEAPGMCKHLIKTVMALNDSKIMEG